MRAYWEGKKEDAKTGKVLDGVLDMMAEEEDRQSEQASQNQTKKKS